jgi:hypothetical protein
VLQRRAEQHKIVAGVEIVVYSAWLPLLGSRSHGGVDFDVQPERQSAADTGQKAN